MKCALLTAIVCLLSVNASETAASPAMTTWTTYLYQGPSYRYAVADEVPPATHLDDAQCSAGWCKVILGSHVGYIRAEIVVFGNAAQPGAGVLPQPAAALQSKPAPGACVAANQTGGNGGSAMTLFCVK